MFHKARELYAVGQIIAKGHWIQLTQGMGTRNENYVFFSECLFEYVRQTEFPSALSRTSATFVFESEGDAQRMPDRSSHYPEHIYRVRPAGNPCTQFKADMGWLTALENASHTFDGVQEFIRSYWRGDPYFKSDESHFEILLDCNIEIIERLTPIPENGFAKR